MPQGTRTDDASGGRSAGAREPAGRSPQSRPVYPHEHHLHLSARPGYDGRAMTMSDELTPQPGASDGHALSSVKDEEWRRIEQAYKEIQRRDDRAEYRA